jgi:chitinase
MSYDLHGSWQDTMDHNAPLYSRNNEVGAAKYLNIDWAVNYWLNNGCPKEKLVIGLANYGRVFKVKDQSKTEPGSLNNGTGTAGKYTREAGFLSYYEICEKLNKEGWKRYWSLEQKVPYAYGKNREGHFEWVAFDDEMSLRIKAAYIVRKNLAGVMFWAIDLDDFNGVCNQGKKYPLIKSVRNEILKMAEDNNEPIVYQNVDKIKEKILACVYTHVALERSEKGRLLPENIDSKMCTHLILAAAHLKNGTLDLSEGFTPG